MNTDLIEQLLKLTPTEGVWTDLYGLIEIDNECLFESKQATFEDCTLVSLAPTMRLAILDMAKEIERLQMKLGLATIELKSCRDKL